jgi:hypothetical protein
MFWYTNIIILLLAHHPRYTHVHGKHKTAHNNSDMAHIHIFT